MFHIKSYLGNVRTFLLWPCVKLTGLDKPFVSMLWVAPRRAYPGTNLVLTDILGDQPLLSSTSTYYPPITIINDLLIDSEEKRNSYTFEHWNYWSSPASPASIYQYSRSILRRNSRKKKKRKTRDRKSVV